MFVEVEIKISALLNDLRSGLSWLEQDNTGNGSIQQKYEMEDQDVEDIKQHPAFQKPIRTFKIVDDTQKKQQPVAVKSDVTPVQENLFPVVDSAQLSISSMEPISTNEIETEVETNGAMEFLNL